MYDLNSVSYYFDFLILNAHTKGFNKNGLQCFLTKYELPIGADIDEQLRIILYSILYLICESNSDTEYSYLYNSVVENMLLDIDNTLFNEV